MIKLLKKLLLTICLLAIPLQVFGAAISTLTDNFNDNSIDAAKWNQTTASGATIAETNGQLEITTSTTAGTNAYLTTVSNYNFTGSAISIKIVDAGNQSLASYTCWVIEYPNNNWRISGGNIVVRRNSVSVYTDTYVANTYRYLRIREAGGNTYWDYSADGITWTNAYNNTNTGVVTSIQFILADTYCSGAEASTTTAKVDDFNILPSATRRIIFIQ
jgi:hypothetical protein